MKKLDFSSIHYVNGHIDYNALFKKNETIEYSYLNDNDKLRIYNKLRDKGKISFVLKDKTHYLKYKISDFNGNKSVLSFSIINDNKPDIIYRDTIPYKAVVNWNKDFDFSEDGMAIDIPASALFNDMKFRYSVDSIMHNSIAPFYASLRGAGGLVAPLYSIQDKFTALNAAYTLKLKPFHPLPDSLSRKAVMVLLDGNTVNSIGGKWDNGYLEAHPKVFGNFTIMVDNKKPIIKPLNINSGKNMEKDTVIEFEITDNLSGIGGYNAYIDGNWVLMEYNPKINLIYYTFDEHVKPGTHHILLVVSDNVGNVSEYKTTFIR
jgi:hypothetical protein